jgi:hypothetical protein
LSRFALWALVLGVMFAGRGSALDNTIPTESFRITFGLKDEVRFEFAGSGEEPGRSYYYARVMQNDGEMAWRSPM